MNEQSNPRQVKTQSVVSRLIEATTGAQGRAVADEAFAEKDAALAALNAGTVSTYQYVIDFAEGAIKYNGSDPGKLSDRNLLANKVAMNLAVTAVDKSTYSADIGKLLLQSISANASTQDAIHTATLVLKATSDLAALSSPAAKAAE